MEAYPPGSDQLLSWERHTLRSTPGASRGYTTQLSEERGREGERGERTPFDITLGSNLIQFEFSYPLTFPCIPICLADCGLLRLCNITTRGSPAIHTHVAYSITVSANGNL